MSGPSKADREQFFRDTFVPVSATLGTSYETCTYEEILAYTSAIDRPKCCLPKAHSTGILTKYLTEHWPNERAKYALDRIQQAISTPNWGPDLLIKLIPDLDTAFFNSRLRTHVQVAWEDGSTILLAFKPNTNFDINLGSTSFDSVNNTSYIRLNRTKICQERDPRVAMLETLVHEMVHAWATLYCRPEPQDPIDSREEHRSGHGWHFKWILNLLDKRTRKHLGFGTIGQWEESVYRIADMKTERQNLPFCKCYSGRKKS